MPLRVIQHYSDWVIQHYSDRGTNPVTIMLFSCIIKWVHSAKTQSGIVTISQDKALLVLLFINFTAQIL